MTIRRVFILAGALIAAAMEPPAVVEAATPAARCAMLYDLYYNYVDEANHHHDGERQQAEYAKYSCEQGRTAEGLRALEAILTRNLVHYPKD
jgi:hypothetical protein